MSKSKPKDMAATTELPRLGQYDVVRANSPEQLAKLVNQRVGWVCLGGIASMASSGQIGDGAEFFQAMQFSGRFGDGSCAIADGAARQND